MPDPNLTIPDSATPNWLLRYGDRRARAYARRKDRTRHLFPRLRTQRARRTLVCLLAVALTVAVAAAVATFWNRTAATIPFTVAVLATAALLTTIRVTTDAVADAPADGLDEIQLAQRNAARSLTYTLIVPIVLAFYLAAIWLSTREEVAGATVGALAMVLVAVVLATICLPDVLLTWWLVDDDEEENP